MPAMLRYLAALRAGRAVALIDPGRPHDELIRRFRPAAVLGADPLDTPPPGYTVTTLAWVRDDPDGVAAASRSGRAAADQRFHRQPSPGAVRPRTLIMANAAAIAYVLGIGPADVAPTSLPLHYSYGCPC